MLSVAGAVLCLYAAWWRARLPVVVAAACARGAAGRDGRRPGRPAGHWSSASRSSPRSCPGSAPTSPTRSPPPGGRFSSTASPALRCPATLGCSHEEIAANRRTLDNVPLWDASVLRPAMDELQSIGTYYSFPSTTVDRYTIGGRPRLLTLAARQLDLEGVKPDARSWANERFAYTHGYGVVATEAQEVDDEQQPGFAQRDVAHARNPLRLREPRIYFGERPDFDPPYSGPPDRPWRGGGARAGRGRARRVPLRRRRWHPAVGSPAAHRLRSPLRGPQAAADADRRQELAPRAASRRTRAPRHRRSVRPLGRAVRRRLSSTDGSSSSSMATRPAITTRTRPPFVSGTAGSTTSGLRRRASWTRSAAASTCTRPTAPTRSSVPGGRRIPGCSGPPRRCRGSCARTCAIRSSCSRPRSRSMRPTTSAQRLATGPRRTPGSDRCSSPARRERRGDRLSGRQRGPADTTGLPARPAAG